MVISVTVTVNLNHTVQHRRPTVGLSDRIAYEYSTELNSLRWFSQRRSRTLHFGGVHTRGGYDTKFELGQDFCTTHPPPSFIMLCLLVRKLSCWETHPKTHKHTDTQTNRFCW